MVFSSNIFLFVFLPAFLAIYYLTPDRYRLRNAVVLLGSYVFYAWWRVDFLFLFIGITAWNYLVGLRIGATRGTPLAKRWLVAGVTVDLLSLGYFKYANFGIANIDTLLTQLGMQPLSVAPVILPIGISFYVFESISYIADVYRGDAQATKHPVDFATFVALFPHLIAGPVFRYKDLEEQFTHRTHTIEKFGEGAVRFMQGFIKKVFIADTLAPLVDQCFALSHPSTGDAWLGALAYTLQLYFDFSGYSDMAIGLGLMMGFRFVENFNQPYISQSITEFWRRWHMSLSSWLRDYLYIALGGNRHGTAKTYRNLFLTMLLGGLWHGANWTFVLWGAWHGGLLAIERALGIKGRPGDFRLWRWVPTMLFVVLGWVMFRAANAGEGLRMLGAMLRFDGGISEVYGSAITRLQLATLLIAALVSLWTGWRALHPQVQRPDSAADLPGPGDAPFAVMRLELVLVPLFVLAVLKLSAQSYSPFLYFQF